MRRFAIAIVGFLSIVVVPTTLYAQASIAGSVIRPRSGSFSCVGRQTHGAAQFQNDPQPPPDDVATVYVRRHTVLTRRPAGTGWL